MNEAEERPAVVQRQLEAAAAGIRPRARLMQDDGAILQLGRFEAKAEGKSVGADKRTHAGMDDGAVAGELEGSVRSARHTSLAHYDQPVLHLCRRLQHAVRRLVARDHVEREMRDRRRLADRLQRLP